MVPREVCRQNPRELCKEVPLEICDPVARHVVDYENPRYNAPQPVVHCSRQDPCEYGYGNCKRIEEDEWIHDDEACEDGLVCGVDNCGSVGEGLGYMGSCCVNIFNSTFEMDDKPRVRSCLGDTEAVPGGYSEWGPWEQDGGWARQRTRVFWPRNDCRTFGSPGSTEVVCVTQRLQTERQVLS